jgi:hypothetical protein
MVPQLESNRRPVDESLPPLSPALGVPAWAVLNAGLPNVGCSHMSLPDLGLACMGLPNLGRVHMGLPHLGFAYMGLPHLGRVHMRPPNLGLAHIRLCSQRAGPISPLYGHRDVARAGASASGSEVSL